MYITRIEKLREKITQAGLDRLVLGLPSNIYYLTGIRPNPMERLFLLLVSPYEAKLVVNQLMPAPAPEDVEVIFHTDWDDWAGAAAVHIREGEKVGLDTGIAAGLVFDLMDRKPHTRFLNGSDPINALRMIKEPEEIELMRTASRINDACMKELIEAISPDLNEYDFKKRRAQIAEKADADPGAGFGGGRYGANAADPHHPAERSYLKPGDNVLMDIGCRYKQYHSDMTRTVFYKEPGARLRKVYDTVLKAQLAAIEAVRPGILFKDIDAAARRVIEAEGFGERFVHRVGHCIGLDVHESPYVSGNNPLPVAPGMIFSIEPGIYLPGEGAVRIEDLVLVIPEGYQLLNHYPKELQIVE
jgi:Xaa-Pro dipeptidase